MLLAGFQDRGEPTGTDLVVVYKTEPELGIAIKYVYLVMIDA